MSDLEDAGGAPLADMAAERQLLGYLLNRPEAWSEVSQAVSAVDFFDAYNRRMFDAISAQAERGEPVTAEYVTQAFGGDPKAVLFDDVTVSRYFATMMADADLADDALATAEYIFTLSERRAVGNADDTSYRPFASKFGGQRWEEIGAGIEGMTGYSWTVEDIVPMAEITLGFGDSGSGKSFGAFDMGMCIARNLPFNGHNVESGLVVYVAAEAGKGFRKRKLAYSLHHGLQPDAALPFYLMTKRPDFFSSEIDVDALIQEITAICKTYRQALVLIVLDTLSALAPGMNENASQDVSRVRARLVRLLEAFNVSIILIHHKPKGGSTPRGHGSLTADFETTIEFESLEDRKRATVRKQREDKSGIMWEFTLPVVRVGKNKWGNDETSCVVRPFAVTERDARSAKWQATPNEVLFLQSLFEALVEHGEAPPRGLPEAITKAVNIDFVRSAMKQKIITGEEDSTKAGNRFRAAFKRAGDALRRGSVIGFQNPLTWYTGKPVHGFNTSQEPMT